jgi:hypothetical protein
MAWPRRFRPRVKLPGDRTAVKRRAIVGIEDQPVSAPSIRRGARLRARSTTAEVL